MLKEKIQLLAKQYAAEFIEVRHHLHAHPELSYAEFETSKFVQNKLAAFNIPFEVLATTGVVGIIEGKNPSKTKLSAAKPDFINAGTKAVAPGKHSTLIPSRTQALANKNPGSEIPGVPASEIKAITSPFLSL